MPFLAKLVNSKNDPLGSYKSENGKFQHVTPEIQAYSVKKWMSHIPNCTESVAYWVKQ